MTPKASDQDATLAFLIRGTWFRKLPPVLQRRLVERSRLRLFEPRDILLGAHQPPQGFWILLQGQVIVAEVFPDGERFLFHIGGPGFCFGGAILLTGGRTSVEVTASTRARLLLLPAPALDHIFVEEPRFYRAFAELIMQRTHLVLRSLARSHTLPTEECLRLRLSLIADIWAHDGYDEPVIELAISQSELAPLIGISRQTLNRYLARLEDEGLVEVSFRAIRILEPSHLRVLAHQDLGP